MALTGKVALITGSTSGIGLSIARELVKHNVHVVLNGFGSMQEIASLVTELSSHGKGKAVHCAADLTKEKDIVELIRFTKDTFGQLDILINNAGMQHVSPIDTFPVEKWDQILSLNLTAAFHTMRLAIPVMRTNGFGRIINIASTHGIVGSSGKSAYVASKHALIGLTKVVALETATENITCNAVCPGFVLTPLVEAQIKDKMAKSGRTFDEESEFFVSDKQPSKKFVPGNEIAGACLYLLSDHASEVRGAQLVIDGGWTIQ